MRTAQIKRETTETKIQIELNVDGTGRTEIRTGVPFFDHMLELLGRHSLIDISITADGDIDVDYHHTVEDTGIVLGQALRQALGEKRGIQRYGSALLPMDETLARVALDLGGRPFLAYDTPKDVESIRDFSFQLVEEFCRALSTNLQANLHVDILAGRDAHHMAEAIFKGLARALREACAVEPRVANELPTTKGSW